MPDQRPGRTRTPAHDWAATPSGSEDEIIGWIYQFYNAEEKVAIRKRGKPQPPHEVAVINQFFTPRWIVKFLVDNTLGRLWLEMHPDSARVRAKCDYLVPEPLPSGRDAGTETGRTGFALDPDSPINNPRPPPRREAKPITQNPPASTRPAARCTLAITPARCSTPCTATPATRAG